MKLITLTQRDYLSDGTYTLRVLYVNIDDISYFYENSVRSGTIVVLRRGEMLEVLEDIKDVEAKVRNNNGCN